MMANLIEILETISLIKTSLTLESHVAAIRQLERCVVLPMEGILTMGQHLNLNHCSMCHDRNVLKVLHQVLELVEDRLLNRSLQLKLHRTDQSTFNKSFKILGLFNINRLKIQQLYNINRLAISLFSRFSNYLLLNNSSKTEVFQLEFPKEVSALEDLREDTQQLQEVLLELNLSLQPEDQSHLTLRPTNTDSAITPNTRVSIVQLMDMNP